MTVIRALSNIGRNTGTVQQSARTMLNAGGSSNVVHIDMQLEDSISYSERTHLRYVLIDLAVVLPYRRVEGRTT